MDRAHPALQTALLSALSIHLCNHFLLAPAEELDNSCQLTLGHKKQGRSHREL